MIHSNSLIAYYISCLNKNSVIINGTKEWLEDSALRTFPLLRWSGSDWVHSQDHKRPLNKSVFGQTKEEDKIFINLFRRLISLLQYKD